jgi:NADH:ubiquinone oxidoreductase subunit K
MGPIRWSRSSRPGGGETVSLLIELGSYVSHLLEDDRMWWAFVSALYFVIAVYSGMTPRREYPTWFWATYLLISAAILLRISASYRWNDPVTTVAEYVLLITVVVSGLVFFRVVSIYAKNRDEFDKFLSELRDD